VLFAIAARAPASGGWVFALGGAASFVLARRAAVAAGQPAGAAWWRDLPAALGAAALGWGPGLAVALSWRALVVFEDAPRLLQRGGAATGANVLFGTLLLLPLAGEGLARTGPLDRVWNAETLAGASIGAPTATTALSPYWSDRCGGDDAPVLAAFGGSSAGGAWQYRRSPELFFPARLHAALCGEGVAVRTVNYADGGRDSFDIATAARATLAEAPPRVVVLYLGVNDLLTTDSPLTRRERQAALAARSAGVSRVAGWAGRSRLLTGGALLLRGADPRPLVPSVPLSDAEENLRAIVAAAGEHGATVVLVPELASSTLDSTLRPYAVLMARLAGELPGAVLVDPAASFGPEGMRFLADRNHLTPEGADAVAALLLPSVREALATAR
jgi:lysophospholipase L1-like esterase